MFSDLQGKHIAGHHDGILPFNHSRGIDSLTFDSKSILEENANSSSTVNLPRSPTTSTVYSPTAAASAVPPTEEQDRVLDLPSAASGPAAPDATPAAWLALEPNGSFCKSSPHCNTGANNKRTNFETFYSIRGKGI